MTRRTRLLAWSAAVSVVGGFGIGVYAQSVLVDSSSPVTIMTRERLDGTSSLLMDLPGRRINDLLAQLPSNQPLTGGALPSGWSMNQSGKQIHLSGPVTTGPSFRLDGAPGILGNYTGKDATLKFGVVPSFDSVKLRIGALPKVSVTSDLDGILVLPQQASPGWPLAIGVGDDYRQGEFSISTSGGIRTPLEAVQEFQVLTNDYAAEFGSVASESGAKSLQELTAQMLLRPAPRPFVTVFPRTGAFTNITHRDQWGELNLDAPLHFESVPWPDQSSCPSTSGAGFRLTGSSPSTFAGQAACLSGCFPSYDQAAGLKLDGTTDLPVWGLSPTNAMLGIPTGTPPGRHTISSADGSSRVAILILTMQGSVDQSKLWTGQSTMMRLRILGTDQPMPFDVFNRTPGVIFIEGGVRQRVTTPGGVDNAVSRDVKGIHRGDFQIIYSIDVRQACGTPK